MTTIYLVNKKGEITELKVIENPDEVWSHIIWKQPEVDYYTEDYQREVFSKEYIKLTKLDDSPIIINKRFIYYAE